MVGIASAWHARAVALAPYGQHFEVWQGERHCTDVELPLDGAHNRSNALAALVAAGHVGIAPPQAAAALATFAGVKRRMQRLGCVRGVTVYDDFAHHPTAIATTIEGLRARMQAEGSTGRLLAVIEPRSNTMKLGTMKAQLPASLQGADYAWCYTARLGWDPADVLAPLASRARTSASLSALVAEVVAIAEPADRILVMSNGDFGGIQAQLLEGLGR